MLSNYGNFRQLKFSDVWNTAESFTDEYKDSGVYDPDEYDTSTPPKLIRNGNHITDNSANILFYLLYNKYGNSTVASSDINQFKYQVFSLIYEYGPTWEKRVELQNKLRKMSDEELSKGTTQIFNHSLNPSTTPTTEELDYISEQNVSKVKRGKLEQYTQLYTILDTDVTSEFVNKFKPLFLQIVQPELPLWYFTKDENLEDSYD